MLNLEELGVIEVANSKALFDSRETRDRLEFLEELETEREPLRQRIAAALINAGFKLDPEARERVARDEA